MDGRRWQKASSFVFFVNENAGNLIETAGIVWFLVLLSNGAENSHRVDIRCFSTLLFRAIYILLEGNTHAKSPFPPVSVLPKLRIGKASGGMDEATENDCFAMNLVSY
eukprot:scaffold9027_cov107-Cylindrotheca_fusiformis.AAC.1